MTRHLRSFLSVSLVLCFTAATSESPASPDLRTPPDSTEYQALRAEILAAVERANDGERSPLRIEVVDLKPSPGVSVTPDGGSGGTVYTYSGYQLVINVAYEADWWGGDPDEGGFDLACSFNKGTCSIQDEVWVFTTNSENVTISFTPTTAGSGTINFSADGINNSYWDSGSRNYTVVKGTSVADISVPSSVEQYTHGNTATFRVQNTGPSKNYSLSCNWHAGCSLSHSSVTLGSGSYQDVTLTFDGGSSVSTYSIGLTANGTGSASGETASDSESVQVTATTSGLDVFVTPDGAWGGTVHTNATNYSTVMNVRYDDAAGPETGQFSLSCSGTLGITCSVSPSSVSLGHHNGSQNVTVYFNTASSTGSGGFTVTATGTNNSKDDTGSVSYTIVAGTSVSILSAPSSVEQYTTGHTASFRVTNNGGDHRTYTFTCNWSPASCSPSPSSAYLTVGAYQDVTLTFDAGSTVSTYALGLTATAGNEVASNSQNVQVTATTSALAVMVTPDGGSGGSIRANDTTSLEFTVEYDDASQPGSGNFNLTCSGTQGIFGCSVTPSSVTLAQNTPQQVTASFSTSSSAVGVGRVTLDASSTGLSTPRQDTGYVNLSVYDVASVNVVPSQEEAFVQPSASSTVNFKVRFPGQAPGPFTMACGGIAGCSLDSTSYQVGDTEVVVPVHFTAAASGDTSVVTLTATHAEVSSIDGSGSIPVISTSQLLLNLDDANPGLELLRSDCVTIAAGPGAIVCDDFQFGYSFTPVVRMNGAGQIGLIYSNAVTHHKGMIGAHLVLPPGVAEPDTIVATLFINGVQETERKYPASLYQPGQLTRIALDWDNGPAIGPQVVSYDVRLVLDGADTATVSGKALSLDKRQWFGRGWWLAGYENVAPRSDAQLGDVLIWTGGDLSGRAYLKQDDSTYVAWTRSRADTIIDRTSEYVRRVVGGGEVHYDGSGYHTSTVGRNGDTIQFIHAVDGLWKVPVAVTLPTPSGPDTVYQFDYHNTTGALQEARVRSGTGGWDTFDVDTEVNGGLYRITSITAPDSSSTTLWYAGTGGVLDSIKDARGAVTRVSRATKANKVTEVRVKSTASGDIVFGYRAYSRVGLNTSGVFAPKAADDVYARLDGPLSGTSDLTYFYSTGWGGVRGVQDALGNQTWIDREDGGFPALPTRIRHPNGWEVTTSYTSLGLPDTIIDRSNGAMTTVEWNNTWAAPTKVTSPEGVVTALVYDGSGNLVKQAVGPDTVRMYYNADGLVDSIADPLGAKTKFSHDARGNDSQVLRPDTTWTRYVRDYRGYPTQISGPAGPAFDSVYTSITYDAMGRDSVVATGNSLDSLQIVQLMTYEFGQPKTVEPLGIDWTGSALDTTRIGVTQWTYDQLGRPTVVAEPASSDTLTYDLAGNVTKVVSNGDTISMTYDVLGRLRSRRTSARSYTTDTIPGYGWIFPQFTTGLPIAAATDTFTYDLMGNLRTANNAYSRIGLGYALNGALVAEVDSLKNYGSSSFVTHVYERSYAYDLDGRRVAMVHPTWINSGTDRTDYTYSSVTGRLSNVKDAFGNTYAFTYDANGQRTVTTAPSAVDSVTYFAGGRSKTRRTRVDGSLSDSLDFSYDDARRLLFSGYEYNGLGGVAGYIANDYPETFTRNPFGSVSFHQSYRPEELEQTELELPPRSYITQLPQWVGGRLGQSYEVWDFNSSNQPSGWSPGTRDRYYDSKTGDLTEAWTNEYTWTYDPDEPPYTDAEKKTRRRSIARSYYAADGKLMVHQVNRDSIRFNSPTDSVFGQPWGVYEEYWYDALGRRVLKRSRQETPICTHAARCYSAIERYVWDGAQILWEFRQGGAGDAQDPGPTATNGQTGHVGYVHAGGIDLPLGMIRNDTSVVLHRDHRGLYYGATTTAGGVFGPNVPWQSTSSTLAMNAFYPRDTTQAWVGSLPLGHLDHTGLLYRRNRYYDPVSGQFTQPDPIGFAGGLNIYGYASGDPINRSDPFGLAAAAIITPIQVRDECEEMPGWPGCGDNAGSGDPRTTTTMGGGGGPGGAGRSRIDLSDTPDRCAAAWGVFGLSLAGDIAFGGTVAVGVRALSRGSVLLTRAAANASYGAALLASGGAVATQLGWSTKGLAATQGMTGVAYRRLGSVVLGGAVASSVVGDMEINTYAAASGFDVSLWDFVPVVATVRAYQNARRVCRS